MNKDVCQTLDQIVERISQVIIDKKTQIEMILATWLMDGHVLLEDLPGTGKTVLAKCFSKVCQVDFGRVQFTPDLLPSDILGTTIYDQETKKFFFRKGLFLVISFLLMKSIVPLQELKQPCSRQWRKDKFPSRIVLINFLNPFLSCHAKPT